MQFSEISEIREIRETRVPNKICVIREVCGRHFPTNLPQISQICTDYPFT